MSNINSFFKVFDAFQKVTGYTESYASRIAFGGGMRAREIQNGSRVSFQVLEAGIERMAADWPADRAKDWPKDGWPRPKLKTGRNQTELSVAR